MRDSHTVRHAGEHAEFLKAAFLFGGPCWLLLGSGEAKLLYDHTIGVPLFVLLLVLNIPVGLAGAWIIVTVAERGGSAFAKAVYASGNLRPEPAFSSQESLIARGLYHEAEASFLAHHRDHPGDVEAGLRLADLYRLHLDQPDEAERLYREMRRQNPTPRQAVTISNTLIDLYRKTGRRDRLKVELGRFADQYRGTRAGKAAKQALEELKTREGQ